MAGFDFSGGSSGGGSAWSSRATKVIQFDDLFNVTGMSSSLNSGTGSSTANAPAEQDAHHIGVSGIDTGTTTSGYASRYINNLFYFNNGEVWEYEALVKLSAVPDGTDTYYVECGFKSTATNSKASRHGALLEIDYAVSTTNWLCTTSNAGTATQTDSGIAFDTNWVKLRVVYTVGTGVDFYIDGTRVVAGQSTNLPTSTTQLHYPVVICAKTAGTNSRTLAVDYFGLEVTVSR